MRCLPLTAVLLAAMVLLVVTSLGFWMSPYLLEEGDMAANALQVERAREGRELLGPYSQHGFNHPGPVSFHLQARAEPLFTMFPSLMARHYAAQTILNFLACLGMLWLLGRGGARPTTIAGGVFLLMAPLLFLAGGNAIMLMSLWGPSMVMLPMALAVVAVARFGDGDLAALPIAAAAAVTAGHNHVLTLPALTLLAIAAMVSRARSAPPFRPEPGSRRGRILIGLAIAVVMAGMLPILIEQFTARPGNLTLMSRWFFAQTPGSHPWVDVLTTLGQAFTDPLVVLFPRAASILAGPVVTAAVVALLLTLSAWVDQYRPRPWRSVLRLVWLVVVLTALLARGVSGRLEPYLFYYLYGLVGVMYLAIADGLTSLLPRRHGGSERRATVIVAVVGVVGLGAWLSHHPLAAPSPRDEVGDLIRALDPRQGELVALVLGSGPDDGDLWPQIPTHALRLRRAGCRVVVPERFEVMCGQEMAGTSGRPAEITLEFSRVVADSTVALFFARDSWGILCRSTAGARPILAD